MEGEFAVGAMDGVFRHDILTAIRVAAIHAHGCAQMVWEKITLPGHQDFPWSVSEGGIRVRSARFGRPMPFPFRVPALTIRDIARHDAGAGPSSTLPYIRLQGYHRLATSLRPSVGLYIHGGTCPILQASRHQWQAGRPTQHSTGTFLAVVCELYCTAFSSTFGTLTDFYSGIISSALSTEPVKCANLALENNFLFSLNYPLLSCGALRLVLETIV
ncbi:unnamed protein product, partial [Nesidiocoris tenuis]